MKAKYTALFSALVALGLTACSGPDTPSSTTQQTLSLAGDWQVKLDPQNKGVSENWAQSGFDGQKITLPGTLDDAKLGTKNPLKPEINNDVMAHLAREYEYIGAAWYQKDVTIPQDWQGDTVALELERVIWQSEVFVDGKSVGTQNSLVAAHNYDLTSFLSPGKHRITVRIDNGDKFPGINITSDKYPREPSQEMAHAYTNHTQIKWNGMLGDISLTASSANMADDVQVYPSLADNTITVTFDQKTPAAGKVAYTISNTDGTLVAEGEASNATVKDGKVSFTIAKPDGIALWDEFNPNVYQLAVNPANSDSDTPASATFGFREISEANGDLLLNGQRIFLRGNLDAAIFPLTGHPPMDKDGWLEILKQAKAYGLNHFRFHSWAPPAAAFEAADEVGFYYQVELPHWSLHVGADKATTDFLRAEGQRIIEEYGNHPSFIMMAMGNELEGDLDTLRSLVNHYKSQDSRHLYASTAFSFQKPSEQWPLNADEFYITQWTEKGWVRGQGIFNTHSPSFDKDYTDNAAYIGIPLISHEIGQYSVYPDMSEIPKYTGVLKPLNFIAIKEQLEQKGLIDLADKFTYASGKLAAILYKEEIERALKTPSFDGFQLLQLQDFPGQGTALVGLLNAFWGSKGVISAEEFRQFNSELVPLIRYSKAVYQSGETFEAAIEVANFFKDLKNQKLHWSVTDNTGTVVAQDDINNVDLTIGNNVALGNISLALDVKEARQMTVRVEVDGTNYKNTWSFWVYPQDVTTESNAVVSTTSFDAAEAALKQGKTVFLNPDYHSLQGTDGRFVPVFWSPVHFPNQPSTMGLLMDPKHPALAAFPTSSHTDWQWWDMTIQSKSIEVDESQVTPIIRVIDNFVTNRHLANVVEAKVGKGKLVFSSIDLTNNLDSRPAARQLKHSLLAYMQSDAFAPEKTVTIDALKALQSSDESKSFKTNDIYD
ncbi:hypothetical protein L9G15_18280 [Shewanella sp. A3A]|nr:hypothetical protein [Shewanella ferrihydritica]